MHPRIISQFRMERGYKMPALFHKNGVALILCQHVYVRSSAANDRSANKDGLYIAFTYTLLKIPPLGNMLATLLSI